MRRWRHPIGELVERFYRELWNRWNDYVVDDTLSPSFVSGAHWARRHGGKTGGGGTGIWCAPVTERGLVSGGEVGSWFSAGATPGGCLGWGWAASDGSVRQASVFAGMALTVRFLEPARVVGKLGGGVE